MKMKLMTLAAAATLLFACGNNSSSNNGGTTDSATTGKSDSANMSPTGTLDSSTRRTDSVSGPSSAKADETTSTFLTKAANAGLAEVKLGQLAKEKGTAASVKEFADMMVTDHSAANDKVKQLASSKSVTLPTEPDAEHQKKADDLSKKTGKDFDKEYVDAMVKGHKETVDMFKTASNKVTDPQVKAFIDNTIPTLEHHLQRIQEIKRGMK